MITLPAHLTVDDARTVRASIADAIRQDAGAEVAVDASGLQRFDSSALAVLLAAGRLAGAAGKRFTVRNLPPQLASLAVLYGIEPLLPMPVPVPVPMTVPVPVAVPIASLPPAGAAGASVG